MVLGNLLWELLGATFDYLGRVVTLKIITAARRAAEREVQPIATVQTEEPDGRDIRFLEAQAQAREQRRAS